MARLATVVRGTVDGGNKLLDRALAFVAVAGQGPAQDVVQGVRDGRIGAARGYVHAPRQAPRQQLVGQRGQGKQVGARVHRQAVALFGRPIVHGALGQAKLGRRVGFDPRLGQAEIRYLDLAVSAIQDVLRLQIEMEDPLGVNVAQGTADGADDADGLVDGPGLSRRHQRAQARAVDVVHHEIGTVRRFTEAVYGDDVPVGQGGHEPRLALKSPNRLARREDLDRHLAPRRLLQGAVDRAGAAFAQLFQQAKARYLNFV